MSVERTDPPLIAGEREMLNAWLDWQRGTLAVKCEGLSDEQLRERAVPPSELCLLGLVRHMAEVERNWFRRVLGREDIGLIYSDDGDFNAAIKEVDTAEVAEAFATWEATCAQARIAEAAAESLEVTGERRGHTYSLRWILVHMIEEYARHNGHADLLRERIDGSTGL
ncbi:MAG TPA: DinB family protein [Acidimicrobiales bacterium]|nr:DinB family protein [Acidimicrobiales bacterium]